MSKAREFYAKDIPALVESAQNWMLSNGSSGAIWMLSYMYGQLINDRKEPDELSERLAKAQAKRCAASLKVADLYAVSKNKLSDVLVAAEQLPEDLPVERHYFDTDNGFILFESPYTGLLTPPSVSGVVALDDMLRDYMKVVALSWRIFGSKIHIYAWTETDGYLKRTVKAAKDFAMSPREVQERIDKIGKLIICGEHLIDLRDYMAKSKYLRRQYGRDSLSILLAACLMLRQEVTARSRIDAPRGVYRFGQRIDMNGTRAVTIIDKRSIKSNPTNEELPDKPGKRQLSVRYDVRGHWRQYKNERFSPEVREYPIWIPAHWVGDESLPVVDRKKVTRLKR